MNQKQTIILWCKGPLDISLVAWSLKNEKAFLFFSFCFAIRQSKQSHKISLSKILRDERIFSKIVLVRMLFNYTYEAWHATPSNQFQSFIIIGKSTQCFLNNWSWQMVDRCCCCCCWVFEPVFTGLLRISFSELHWSPHNHRTQRPAIGVFFVQNCHRYIDDCHIHYCRSLCVCVCVWKLREKIPRNGRYFYGCPSSNQPPTSETNETIETDFWWSFHLKPGKEPWWSIRQHFTLIWLCNRPQW